MEASQKKNTGELAELENELRFKLPKEIQKAREFGDLKENAEYKAALERQKMVMARVVQLSERLASRINRFIKDSDRPHRLRFDGCVIRFGQRRRPHLPARYVGRKRSGKRFDFDRFPNRSIFDGKGRRRRGKSENAERLAQF
jgi:hypothetical protein